MENNITGNCWVHPEVVKERRKVAAFASYNDLTSSIANLLHRSKENSVTTQTLERELSTARESLSRIGPYFSDIFEPKYYCERRQPDSTIAQRVFSLRELAEQILLHLEFRELLDVMCVSRTFLRTILDSVVLKQELFLAPETSRINVVYPPGGRWGMKFHRHTDNWGISGTGKARVVCGFIKPPRGGLSRIGLRYRQMFICQPPVQEMNIEILNREDVKPTPLFVSTGITFGDLYDRQIELWEQYGHGKINFKGEVALRRFDHQAAFRREQERAEQERIAAEAVFGSMMGLRI